MHIANSLYYLNLARVASFTPWDGGATITTNNITFDSSGTLGKVGSNVPIFNGTSSYAKLIFTDNKYSLLQNASAISIGGWFYLEAVNRTQVLYHLGDSLTQGIVIEAINTNLRCIVGTYDSNYDDCTNVLTTGWHNIFITCTNTQRIIYLDGLAINEANKTYTFASLSDTQYMGAFKGTSNFFLGRVQMFHFAATCLSVKQIKFLAEAPTFLTPLYDVNVGYGLDDHSGNSRDPSAVGSFTLDTDSPRFTSAIKFSGSASKYINMGSYVQYLQYGYTLSVRFKTTETDTAQVLVDNCKYSNYGCRIFIGSNNCVRVAHGYGTGNYNISGSEIEINKWYMLTATWDCSKLRIYLNGVLDLEQDAPETFVPNTTHSQLIVGKSSYQYADNNYQYAYPFYGSLCDVRVYCTALSAERIYELYSVPIQIDSKGTIWGFQLIQNENQTSFTSKGIVATGTFSSTDNSNAPVRISQSDIEATYFEMI